MTDQSGSALIDDKLRSMGDWRGATLARLRRLIQEADPAVVETVAQAVEPVRRSGVGA